MLPYPDVEDPPQAVGRGQHPLGVNQRAAAERLLGSQARGQRSEVRIQEVKGYVRVRGYYGPFLYDNWLQALNDYLVPVQAYFCEHI